MLPCFSPKQRKARFKGGGPANLDEPLPALLLEERPFTAPPPLKFGQRPIMQYFATQLPRTSGPLLSDLTRPVDGAVALGALPPPKRAKRPKPSPRPRRHAWR